jgi:hypothetical protein
MRSWSPARLIWHPDKWDRLVLAASCVQGARSVLDVGGRGGEMARLLPKARVISANVEPPADVLLSGEGKLPFADDSFEMVTSCDVLEHIPPEERASHLAELVRVAERRVVVCCPLGTPHHVAAEHELERWLREEIGINLEFLDEHLRYGIPDESEVRTLIDSVAPAARLTLRFHGDVDAGNRVLMDGVRARWRRNPLALVRYLRRAYLIPRRPRLEANPHPATNRIYAIIEQPEPA